MIPYSLVTFIWVLIDYLLGMKYSFLTIFTSILGINTRSPIDKTMWYISYLFLYYILFYISFKFIRNRKCNLIFLFLCSFIIILLYKLGLWTSKTSAHIYTFCFPIGVLLGMLSNKNINFNIMKYIRVAALINLIIFICTAINMKNGILVMINVISFSLASVLLISLINIKRNRVIEFIGQLSFYIYLFEGVFLDIKYGQILNFTNYSLLEFILYLLIVISLSLILRKLVNKVIKFISINFRLQQNVIS